MKKYSLIFFLFFLLISFIWPQKARAMPLGTLLYRTSSDGQMYGYSGLDLVKIERGILKHLYTGHVGIYVGQENGVDYVVEALANGIVKTPAKNFVNRENGEKLIGAKLPIKASPLERVTAVLLAKNIAITAPAYDFDFQTQKGPGSGQWICSGFVEKIYESANTGNPYDLRTLRYNPLEYGVDITPDGFDDTSVVNSSGDVLSQVKEFSQISPREKILVPLSEKFGYNIGLEKAGKRYFFLPFTQFSQASLTNVKPDIVLDSRFNDEEIRGKPATLTLILKWSLVNNPVSSLKLISQKIKSSFFPSPIIVDRSNSSELPSTSLNIMPAVVQKETNWSDLFPNPSYRIIDNVTTSTKKQASSSPAQITLDPVLDRVIDGDTFVLKDGRKVRYLDLDAPEIASETRKTTECRGPEAKKLNEQLLSSGKLILIADPLAKKDSYSRWLFYVYLLKPDGSTIFVNQEMVKSGLADVFICPLDKPSCPKTGDFVRQKIIEEAGLQGEAKKAEFLQICAAEKAAAKLASSSVVEKIPTSTVKIATSTAKISTSTPKISTSTVKVISSSTVVVAPVVQKPVVTPASGGGGGSSAPSLPALLSPLITKIFSHENNHWLELFNPNNQVYDLALYNYRLEKAKTTLDPGIILRFSEALDFQTNSSLKIPARKSYLVVGEKSDPVWLSKADAVVLNPDFTWGKNGYTLYSALNPVSSPDDQDILEKIGFGSEALYFSATSAPALSENAYLTRVKNSDGSFSDTRNNFLDFQLFSFATSSASSTPSSTPITDEIASSTPTSTTPIASSTPTSTQPLASSTSLAINSPDLSEVWHFDDCEGNYAQNSLRSENSLTLPSDFLFDFGKNGCALKPTSNGQVANVTFGTPFVLDEASIAFYYLAKPGANLSFWLNQQSETPMRVDLQVGGLNYVASSSFSTSSVALIPDNNWHQLVATFSSQAQVVIFYQDGEEIARFFYPNILTLNNFAISGSQILIDELAFWRRPLVRAELLGFFQLGKPFYSSDLYNPLMIPQKAYYWHLGEVESHFDWYDQPKRKVLPGEFMPRDFSYEFWWRNSSYPEDGRIMAALLNGEEALMTSVLSMWFSRWSFGSVGGLLYGQEPFIPTDDLWHHFALTYNSQDMMGRWYIDGQEIFSTLAVWLKKPVKEIMIKAENYPFELSDFSIWEGTLSQSAIQELVNLGRPFSGQ